jgi:lipopolysaccharide transport system permease protein
MSLKLENASMEWTIEPRGDGLWPRVRDVWRSRHLVRYFGSQALDKAYSRTLLGWTWLFARALFPALVGTFVFGNVVGVEHGGDVPYFLFFLTGMSCWHLFDQSLMWITRSLESNRRLLTKMYFPRLILPVANVAPALAEFLVQLILLLSAALYYFVKDGRSYLSFGPPMLAALVALFLSVVLALGLGFWTSVLGANYRDVRFALRYVMGFWYFLTPVIYPVSRVPENLRWLVELNPMASLVQMFRWGMIGHGEVALLPLAGALSLMCAVFLGGVWFFGFAEGRAVDKL